jgi:RNA polymerase sigma factor (sigma-70 family)
MKTLNREETFEMTLKNWNKYIIKIADSFSFNNYDKQELTQIGSISLFNAFNNYDENKGTFKTFAIQYIRGGMMNYLTTNGRTIKITGYAIKQKIEIIKTISIDKTHTTEDGNYSISELIKDDIEDNELDDKNKLIIDLLSVYISKLSKDYQTIIKMVYFDEMKLIEIAKELNQSSENIRLKKNRAIEKLKKMYFKNNKGTN